MREPVSLDGAFKAKPVHAVLVAKAEAGSVREEPLRRSVPGDMLGLCVSIIAFV